MMLGGHSHLVAPPELFLLPYDTMGKRASSLQLNDTAFLKEGLIEAVRNLEGISIQEAVRCVEEWENEKLTVAETSQWLLRKTKGRYLVDKCPMYAMDKRILERAECFAPKPFYIHLIRHPLAVAASYVKNRFHKILGHDDPWAKSDVLWQESNTNIHYFLGQIPTEQHMMFRYEELVKEPEKILKSFCFHMGL